MRRERLCLVLSLALAATTIGPARAASAEVPRVLVSVGDASVWEGNGGSVRSGTIALTLSAPSAMRVTVEYVLAPGSAAEAADFKSVASPRSVSFGVGTVRKYLPVTVFTDVVPEGDETFQIVLSNATGPARIGDGTGVVTIIDDDTAATPGVEVSDASVWEGDGSKPRALQFWVSLPAPSQTTVSVALDTPSASALNGTDFRPVARVLTFLPGQVKKPINIAILPDASTEGDETFSVRLTADMSSVSTFGGAVIADATGVGTILDDDRPPLQYASAVAAGAGHSCAVVNGGEVVCWGNNWFGQLGDGTTLWTNTPVRVHGLSTAVAVAAGIGHTCALLVGGAVQCWGDGRFGALGNGSWESSSVPVDVLGIADAVLIAAGNDHTCVVLGDGSARCWGGPGFDGELGNGPANGSNVPVVVPSVSGATRLAAGGSETCVVVGDAAVRCWGSGGYGQLGNGSSVSAPPVEVLEINSAVDVAVGGEHACAVLVDGTSRCWGWGEFGQLGNGLNETTSVPVQVSGIANAVSIAAGEAHTCARLVDQSVQCWGKNISGQLGDGTNAGSNVPVSVSGLSGVVDVVGGGLWWGPGQSCAVLEDGSVWCWGDNYSGQLGDGTNSASRVPVVVLGSTSSM